MHAASVALGREAVKAGGGASFSQSCHALRNLCFCTPNLYSRTPTLEASPQTCARHTTSNRAGPKNLHSSLQKIRTGLKK